ncbi:MAG: hypothetical protein FWG63_08365 [Defluviitaleaceae bacterium]|nr:hypothetical protein [Defluviitaleaceae bacterium]
MITKFKKPIKTKSADIDELYDGKYVAYLQTSEMFGNGIGFVVATSEKTREAYTELLKYIEALLENEEDEDLRGGVRVGNKNREDEELYVIFRDVR